jgi:hypothetical protein
LSERQPFFADKMQKREANRAPKDVENGSEMEYNIFCKNIFREAQNYGRDEEKHRQETENS